MHLITVPRCLFMMLVWIASFQPTMASTYIPMDTTTSANVELIAEGPKPKKNKLAVWSLILSCAGFVFTFIPIISILSPFLLVGGVVAGIISLGQIKKRKEKGAGLAIAGLIVGGVSILAAFVAVLVLLSIFN